MRLTGLIIVLLVAVVAMAAASTNYAQAFPAATYLTMFRSFITKMRRSYTGALFTKRLEVFKKNVDLITALNKMGGKMKYVINDYADKTAAEFQKTLGTIPRATSQRRRSFIESSSGHEAEHEAEYEAEQEQEHGMDADLYSELKAFADSGNLPEAFDWSTRSDNPHGPIVFQGDCGSCWAFAAAATLEAQLALKLKRRVKLSEQAFLSCASTASCGGGHQDTVYEELDKGKTKMVLSHRFPYLVKSTPSICASVKNTKDFEDVAFLDRYKLSNKHDIIKASLVKNGPLSVIVHFFSKMQFAGPGIVVTSNCTGGEPNHAVVLVGYGTHADGTKMWKVRNSHGPTVGDKGYVYYDRIDGKDTCHITSYAAHVTLGTKTEHRKKVVQETRRQVVAP